MVSSNCIVSLSRLSLISRVFNNIFVFSSALLTLSICFSYSCCSWKNCDILLFSCFLIVLEVDFALSNSSLVPCLNKYFLEASSLTDSN